MLTELDVWWSSALSRLFLAFVLLVADTSRPRPDLAEQSKCMCGDDKVGMEVGFFEDGFRNF